MLNRPLKATTLVLLCLLAASRARAEEGEPPPPVIVEPATKSGSVILPSGSSPSGAVALHNRGIDTNLIAVAYRVPASADGATYALTRTSGLGNVDASFYEDDRGAIGANCHSVAEERGDPFGDRPEVGLMCSEEDRTVGWVVVTLRYGFNAGFRLEW